MNVLEDRKLRNEEATINEPHAANEEEQIKADAKKSKIPKGIKNNSMGPNKKWWETKDYRSKLKWWDDGYHTST